VNAATDVAFITGSPILHLVAPQFLLPSLRISFFEHVGLRFPHFGLHGAILCAGRGAQKLSALWAPAFVAIAVMEGSAIFRARVKAGSRRAQEPLPWESSSKKMAINLTTKIFAC
jgi:hypothetical protein